MLEVWSTERSAWSEYVWGSETSAWLAISPSATWIETPTTYIHDTQSLTYTRTIRGPPITRTDGAVEQGKPNATVVITEAPYSYSQITEVYTLTNTPWPPTWSCNHCEERCTIYAPEVKLIYFPVETNGTTSAPAKVVTAVESGYTFTSPSAYLQFASLYAINDCRHKDDFYRPPQGNGDAGYNRPNYIGTIGLDVIMGFRPEQISSVIPLYGDLDHFWQYVSTKPFNFANLNKPWPSSACETHLLVPYAVY